MLAFMMVRHGLEFRMPPCACATVIYISGISFHNDYGVPRKGLNTSSFVYWKFEVLAERSARIGPDSVQMHWYQ